MTLTDPEITAIARELADRIFVQLNATAHSDRVTLKAAIQAIDDAMSATTTQIESQASGIVLKIALRNYIQTADGNLTNGQAAIALALWSLNEAGLL